MIPTKLLDAQAEALNIPVTKVLTTHDNYEQRFINALQEAKTNGAEGILTGDIYDVAQHQAGWLDNITQKIGLTPVRPLWHQDTTKVYKEFINAGFKATVVRVKTPILTMDYLGRTLDQQFYNDLKKLGNVDPCGENGEYHTFVTDGPIFQKQIQIQQTKTSTINSWGRLEIIKFKLTPKDR
jgi:diphthine-ammonia ligase